MSDTPSCLSISIQPFDVHHFKLFNNFRFATFRVFRRRRAGFRQVMKIGGWWQSNGDSPEKGRTRRTRSVQKVRSKSVGNALELEEQSEDGKNWTAPVACNMALFSNGHKGETEREEGEAKLPMIGGGKRERRRAETSEPKEEESKETKPELQESPSQSLLRKPSMGDGRVRSIEKLRTMMLKAPSERVRSYTDLTAGSETCLTRSESSVPKASRPESGQISLGAIPVIMEEIVAEEPIIKLLRVVLEAEAGKESKSSSVSQEGTGCQESIEMDACSSSVVAVRKAVKALWNKTKISRAVRKKMVELGAITALLPLLDFQDALIQEFTVTVLLNLALESEAKVRMVAEEAVGPLLNIVRHGASVKARENAVGAVCSLSVSSEGRRVMVEAGAVELLVTVFASGSTIARKDAGLGLFNLAIDPKCRVDIICAGAVRVILEILEPPSLPEVEEEVMALLSVLTKSPEGSQLLEKRNAIKLLVSVLEEGATEKTRINAAACLLQVASANEKCIYLIRQEGGVFPLLPLSQSPSARGREKANTLLKLLRASQTTV